MAVPIKASNGKLLSVASLVFVISSLLLFILKNLFYSGWTAETATITPLRWVSATVVPVIVVSWGHARQALSTSGALLGLMVGFCLTLSHYSFFMCLLALFITSSKASRYRQRIEGSHPEAPVAPMSWLQILCGGGLASVIFSLLYLLDIGSSDLPVDFRHHYRASWLGVGVLGAVACCCGDTWATQLGSVVAKSNPFLVTTFQQVPKGTNGAVSLAGLVSSLLGGMVVGVAYYLGIALSAAAADISPAPNQLLLILVGGMGGLLGSLVDSLLGASLQFSGKDAKTGKMVEVVGKGVQPITGKMVLDNHSVDLVSSILTAMLLPKVALAMGM